MLQCSFFCTDCPYVNCWLVLFFVLFIFCLHCLEHANKNFRISFLTYRVLAANSEWHDGLCSPTMFSGSIPEPML